MTVLQVCGGFCLVIFSCIYGLRICLCTTVTWFTGGTMVFVVLTPLLAQFYLWENHAWCWSRFKEPPLINTLLASYSCDPKKFEKLPVVSRDPMLCGMLPFEISIANSREDSIREMEHMEEEIQIFTDRSTMNSKVRAAAVLLRAGNSLHLLHIHLGPKSEHTVYEVELAGILLGMHLISTEKQGNTTFAIRVDNQAVIRAFSSMIRRPSHHLARETVQIAQHAEQAKEQKCL